MVENSLTELDLYNKILRKFPEIETIRGLDYSKRFLDEHLFDFLFMLPNHYYVSVRQQPQISGLEVMVWRRKKRVLVNPCYLNLRQLIDYIEELWGLE